MKGDEIQCIVRPGYDFTVSKARLLVPKGRAHWRIIEKMIKQLYLFPV